MIDRTHFRALPRRDLAVVAALGIATVLLVGATSGGVGIVRDEGWHIQEARHYLGWFRDVASAARAGHVRAAFSDEAIDPYWTDNPSHPALVRVAMGATWLVFTRALGVARSNLDGFRVAAWLFAGLSVALTFWLARLLLPRRAAILAAFMWLALPHPFYHMHLGAFDVPVVAAQLWIAIGYLLWRRSIAGAALLGVLFGLGLATKHNVMIMPFVFLAHWIFADVLVSSRGGRVSIPWPAVLTPLAGLAVFVLSWPYLWPDVRLRLTGYWAFHLHHENYPVMWFGRMLTGPPFPIAFPFVMTAITIPLPIAMTFAAGLVLATVTAMRALVARVVRFGASADVTLVPLNQSVDESSASVAMFLALNGLMPFVLIALPSTPKFGGTKHWMNGLPFLCILGAWAVEEGFARWRRASVPTARLRLGFAVMAMLLLLPGAWTIWRTHPFELDSYNEAIGFTRGAANAGMQRTFWGSEARVTLPFVNATAPIGCRVLFGDTNEPSVAVYAWDGLLRGDLRGAGTVDPACAALVEPQGEFRDFWLDARTAWQTSAPAAVVHIEGVPLAVVVNRPEVVSPLSFPPATGDDPRGR